MKKVDYSKIYSFSKLNLFGNCKKQYHFNYLDPEVAPIRKEFIKPRDYKTKGQAVHGAITLFDYLPSEKRTFEELKKCLSKTWFSEIDAAKKPPLGEVGGFESLEHEREAYLDSLKLLKNFFKLEEENAAISSSVFYLPTDNIKNSFSDYQEMIKGLNNEFLISGKFDRIDKLKNGNLRVIDFKTGNGSSNKFQLEFYKLLAELNFKIKVETVTFYNLKKGKMIDYDVADVEQDELKEKIEKKIDQIEDTKEFIPRPSPLCNHCDFQEICPIFKNN